ncbi:MAG: histidine kinase dimerization/phosphoacceptor domain-containing protein [Enterocloster bolteae]
MAAKMAGNTGERNRLAREIHDTWGHTLTGIAAGIDASPGHHRHVAPAEQKDTS